VTAGGRFDYNKRKNLLGGSVSEYEGGCVGGAKKEEKKGQHKNKTTSALAKHFCSTLHRFETQKTCNGQMKRMETVGTMGQIDIGVVGGNQ